MDQHFANPLPTGTVSKPGPGHPVAMLASQLENISFQNVESVWGWVENREGLKHPLDALILDAELEESEL